jgi:hypothetical protein
MADGFLRDQGGIATSGWSRIGGHLAGTSHCHLHCLVFDRIGLGALGKAFQQCSVSLDA